MLTLLRGAKRTTPLKIGLVYVVLAASFLITADLALTAVGAPIWIFSLCLATLSQRVRIRPTGPRPPLMASITLRPRGPVPARVERRRLVREAA